jgi:hypothetical protein
MLMCGGGVVWGVVVVVVWWMEVRKTRQCSCEDWFGWKEEESKQEVAF